jgi:N-acetyl-gamma-glutamyl-phosphate reductase
MQRVSVGVVGASGYSGLEASRILARHPRVDLRFVSSDRWEGETLAARLSLPPGAIALRYAPLKLSLELATGCQIVLLATPAEVSLDLAPRLLDTGIKVVDLSGAFRLRDAAEYPRFYRFEHPRPDLLAEAAYGLPELFRAEIRTARLVANPGCYPTAAALPLAPLLRAGLLEDDWIVVDAASGVTGAGRKATEELSFAEVDGDFRAYRVNEHQHLPEIRQTLARCSSSAPGLTFTPYLLPVKRGILSTAHARLKPGVALEQPALELARAYADEPFVQIVPSPNDVNLKSVVGTNRCRIGLACERQRGNGRLIALASIDNLLKGAAGQAVQNLNLMMDFEETLGLLSQPEGSRS